MIALIAAPNITIEKAVELSALQISSTSEKHSLYKFFLANEFAIEPDQIDAKFLETYNTKRSRRIWKNLRQVNDTVGDSLQEKLQNLKTAQDSKIANHQNNMDLFALETAVGLLNEIFPGIVLQQSLSAEKIHVVDLSNRLQTAIDFIKQKTQTLNLCGLRTTYKPTKDPTLNFKRRLEIVNSIIRHVFGISIVKSVRKMKTCKLFVLKLPIEFTWNDQINKWRLTFNNIS